MMFKCVCDRHELTSVVNRYTTGIAMTFCLYGPRLSLVMLQQATPAQVSNAILQLKGPPKQATVHRTSSQLR